ncbi:wall-associated receptor kinase-like 14 isoform X2 [Diospyros lotus]|uniref:wall-associated receptor kinase-like 14 isoform X2 n=1 Tax=Diospyros lotus TaxID=55363 RepID=UPI00225019C6|nr:wall-associated receptor kinase-like 14 isoform X2 [Diospyros lotus]
MLHRQALIGFIIALLVASSTKADESGQCSRTCGSNEGNQTRVPFPFGFSAGCSIRLNCSKSGKVSIGRYQVQNVTTDSILINLPPKCNRSVEEIDPFFGDNYAPTWQNSFMFQNCLSPDQSCLIPTSMVEARFRLPDCGLRNKSFQCYSAVVGNSELMTRKNLSQTGCQFLFTSIVMDAGNNSDKNSNQNPAVALQFQVAELGWWLHGRCNCSQQAECIKLAPPNGRPGFRCRCKTGFEGDGFNLALAGAGGCRKAPHCSASRYMSGKCGGRTRVGVLIAGIIVGAILMAGLALICYCIQRRSRSLRTQMSAKRLLCEAAGSSSVPFISYRDIERATNSFSEKQRLGTGAYGTVYAGKLHSDEWVAIKKIRHRDADGIEQVMNEIKLLSSVSHPNLVRLLGCCIENGEQILVYEFMPNGTLSQHLQRERGTGLPWTIRLTIATETARAIAYLHSAMNPPIYHRDIKSSNILLDYNYNSKVADFGLSRLGMPDDSHVSTAPQGTPGYVDPQYHQNFHLSDKSDVYSFGVVLVEIITAMKVVDFSRSHTEVNLAALAIDRIGKGRLDEIIDPLLEPTRDAWTLSSIHKMAELAFRCLAFHREMRPSMMEVADELEQIRLSGWAPVEENICMASSCSSPYNGSERSFGGMSARTVGAGAGVGSRRLVVPQRATADSLTSLEEVKDSSPVSVQDPWPSEHSSPSANSLLGNVAK